MEDKKISVIIPVYNVAPYLERCLKSVIDQTYRHLEIIIVDDGSSDGSSEICDRYAHQDSRIHVIHQDNQGLSAARNVGLNIAGGEWIGFVDSDDWIDDDFYEILAKALQDNNADMAMMGYTSVYPCQEMPCSIEQKDCFYDRQSSLQALSEEKIYHVVWNKLYRRELFQDIQFVRGRTYEDVLITYRLFLRAQRIVCLNQYRYHQIMRKSSINHTSWSVVENFMSHYEMWKDLSMQKNRLNVPQEVIDNFFYATVNKAYYAIFIAFVACQTHQNELLEKARTFWKTYQKQIASMNKKMWLAVYFPYPFYMIGWLRGHCSFVWQLCRRCRNFAMHRQDIELFP